jgi:hypothetical protein
LPKCILTE